MRIFFSYHSLQREVVDTLTKKLKSHGIICFTRNLRLNLGNDIHEPGRLEKDIPHCDFIVPIISKSYVRDEWLLSVELNAFRTLEGKQKPERRIIVPVLVDNTPLPMSISDPGRKIANFQASEEEGIEELLLHLSTIREVFVVMKMGDRHLDAIYNKAIKKVVEQEYGYSCVRIDDFEGSEKINPLILHQIERCPIIIADLTGERPNCYYEVGYAHGLNKKLVLTIRNDAKIHFDLQDHRFIMWGSELELADQLRDAFNKITSLRI